MVILPGFVPILLRHLPYFLGSCSASIENRPDRMQEYRVCIYFSAVTGIIGLRVSALPAAVSGLSSLSAILRRKWTFKTSIQVT